MTSNIMQGKTATKIKNLNLKILQYCIFLVFFLISYDTLLLCATFCKLDSLVFPGVTICANMS